MQIPDDSPPFGYYQPSSPLAFMIHLAQRCPPNWLGRRLSLMLRKLVVSLSQQSLDATVEGVRMRFHLHDNVSERKFLFMPRRFDPAERELLRQELPADGIFVDIGANVGIYTLCAARLLNAKGRILAFEPNPPVFRRLQFNCRINQNSQRPRITLLPIGISDRQDYFDLYLDDSNLGGSSLRMQRSGKRVRIQCRPLLDVFREQNIRHVDILKIDIEGAEDIALMPYLGTAEDYLLPRFIIIENSDAIWQSDLHAALLERGYQLDRESHMNHIYRLSR